MSSIGPQLPPSPSKRKRDNEEDDAPSKHPRPNTDEIDLSSSDDDSGPSAGSSTPAQKPPVVSGPSLPNNTDEIDLEYDSDDDTGPAQPPSAPTSSAAPAQPSNPQKAAAEPVSDSDSDSDDYGPALPSASSKPTIGPSLPPSADTDSRSQQPQQRDDWMLAPPSASNGYSERDPSKIRARTFSSKPSGGSSKTDAEISSIWTETPEQKLKRLEDSVLGRSSGGSGASQQQSAADANEAKRRAEEAERDRRIAENIAKGRKGKSLVEEHQERRRKEKGAKAVEEEEDDPSKRAFDREKDMAIGGRMSGKEKRELMANAKGFGNRFQKGSYL